MNSNHRHHHPNEPVFYARNGCFRSTNLLAGSRSHPLSPCGANKQRERSSEHANIEPNDTIQPDRGEEGKEEKRRHTLWRPTDSMGKNTPTDDNHHHYTRRTIWKKRDSTFASDPAVEVSLWLVMTSHSTHGGGLKRLFQLFNIFFAYKNRLTDGLSRRHDTHTELPFCQSFFALSSSFVVGRNIKTQI